MKYLLDTHYLIWAITETSKLSKKVKIILENPKNTILVSAISFQEISLKFSLGKLDLGPLQPENFQTACEQMGCEILDLNAETSSTYHQLLPKYHKDPFDRMLIQQCISRKMIFISKDVRLKQYKNSGLVFIWS